MKFTIYSVTYASYYEGDGELVTETKIFLDEEKARKCQQDNIECVLSDHFAENEFDSCKDDNGFTYECDGWTYSSTLEERDVEFYLEIKN
jgi:hypothetical protein